MCLQHLAFDILEKASSVALCYSQPADVVRQTGGVLA
jgi:hypothetical protein